MGNHGFGLKNKEATYQQAKNKIFHEFIGKFLNCYIDDVVVKSHCDKKHLTHLKRTLERMGKYQLKMNPIKCEFGVLPGNFTGFLIQRGIEVDNNKAKPILEAKAPANKKVMQHFLSTLFAGSYLTVLAKYQHLVYS